MQAFSFCGGADRRRADRKALTLCPMLEKRQKKNRSLRTGFHHTQRYNYSAEIASVGHAAAQVPHSMHSSALIS